MAEPRGHRGAPSHARDQAGNLDRDLTHVLRVLGVAVVIAFPCCSAALVITFLFATTGDGALLTAATWLTRVAEGSAAVVVAAVIRLWWRDWRRRRAGE